MFKDSVNISLFSYCVARLNSTLHNNNYNNKYYHNNDNIIIIKAFSKAATSKVTILQVVTSNKCEISQVFWGASGCNWGRARCLWWARGRARRLDQAKGRLLRLWQNFVGCLLGNHLTSMVMMTTEIDLKINI